MQTNINYEKKVHRSKNVKVLTTVILLILIAAEAYLIYQMTSDSTMHFWNGAIILVLTLTIIFSYGFAPMSIKLTNDSFILRRGIGKIMIPYSDIAEIDIFQFEGPAIRVCGIGGVFGFIGNYYNRKIGKYFSYVSDYSQVFKMRLKTGKTYIFSCEDREYVVFFVRKKMKFT